MSDDTSNPFSEKNERRKRAKLIWGNQRYNAARRLRRQLPDGAFGRKEKATKELYSTGTVGGTS